MPFCIQVFKVHSGIYLKASVNIMSNSLRIFLFITVLFVTACGGATAGS